MYVPKWEENGLFSSFFCHLMMNTFAWAVHHLVTSLLDGLKELEDLQTKCKRLQTECKSLQTECETFLNKIKMKSMEKRSKKQKYDFF